MAQRRRDRRRMHARRSLTTRLGVSLLLGLISGVGLTILLFVLAWFLTRMGRDILDTGDTSAAGKPFAVDLGSLPWMVGALAGAATFIHELAE